MIVGGKIDKSLHRCSRCRYQDSGDRCVHPNNLEFHTTNEGFSREILESAERINAGGNCPWYQKSILCQCNKNAAKAVLGIMLFISLGMALALTGKGGR